MRKNKRKHELVPLTSDFAFKQIFLKNPIFLKKFIKDVLHLDFEIDSLVIQNSELLKLNKNERKKILDVYVVINDFYNLSIELNNCDYSRVKVRNFLYLNSIYNSLYKKGEKIEDVNAQVVQLNLNVLPNEFSNLDSNTLLHDTINNIVTIDNYKIINKNLAYLDYIIYNKDKEKEIAWCRAIKATTYKELDKNLRIVLSDKERKLFLREVRKLNSDNFLKEYWEKEDVNEYVRQSEIKHAKKEGFDNGKIVGYTDGFDNASNEFIKNMLKKNLDLSTISEISGKSKKEIKSLKKQFKKTKKPFVI